MNTASSPPLPARPRLGFRVGFVSSGQIAPEAAARLAGPLLEVLRAVGWQLAALTPGVPVHAGQEPPLAQFYAAECPLLRLVTGLGAGADEIAADTLEQLHVAPDLATPNAEQPRCLQTELAGILPFDLESCRRLRSAESLAAFDRRLRSCAYVVTLDGQPAESSSEAYRRHRAARACAAVLLRHCDLLIVAANPNDMAPSEGTLATMHEANALDIPIVLVNAETGSITLIDPAEDVSWKLAEAANAAGAWEPQLKRLVTEIVGGAEQNDDDHDGAGKHGESLLREFFEDSHKPHWNPTTGKRQATRRERIWNWFESRLRTGPSPASDPALAPYDVWRSRATNLNYHYAGLYRGAFLLNYGLAVAAVGLAAFSLVVFAVLHEWPSEDAGEAHHSAVLPIALLVMAAVKLGVIGFIVKNTHQANHERWNDRAVDYRYLAERLRAMYYLPLAGSFRPPVAVPLQHTARGVRQSSVDWLFGALTRGISPAELPLARPVTITTDDGAGSLTVRVLSLAPLACIEAVRDNWIKQQVLYHARNARTMGKLHLAAEKVGSWMSFAVITFVLIDIVIAIIESAHLAPHGLVTPLAYATLGLIFLAAVLPAAVAALNGIRFQSECRRLAERSSIMRTILAGAAPRPNPQPVGRIQQLKELLYVTWLHVIGRAPEPPDTPLTGGRWAEADSLAQRIAQAAQSPTDDHGAWSHTSLHLVERTAEDFVHEVAEWSVLYAKELPEPG